MLDLFIFLYSFSVIYILFCLVFFFFDTACVLGFLLCVCFLGFHAVQNNCAWIQSVKSMFSPLFFVHVQEWFLNHKYE